MSYIDVLIPLIVGGFLAAAPRIFTKEPKKEPLFRKIGFVLLGVAVVYFAIKQFGTNKNAGDQNEWYAMTQDKCIRIATLEHGLNSPDDVIKKYGCSEEPSASGLPKEMYIRLNCEAKLGAKGHFIFIKGKGSCEAGLKSLPPK